MPTYIYQTIPKKKGQKPKRFELVQSMKDKPLKKHPETGGTGDYRWLWRGLSRTEYYEHERATRPKIIAYLTSPAPLLAPQP